MATKTTVNNVERTTKAVEAPVVESTEKTVETPEPVTKKAAAKKITRKTTAKTSSRKTAAKKTATEMNREVHIQYAGRDILAKDLVSKTIAIWTEEMGKKAEELKDVKVYVNIDQSTAYYVLNEDIKGSFSIG